MSKAIWRMFAAIHAVAGFFDFGMFGRAEDRLIVARASRGGISRHFAEVGSYMTNACREFAEAHNVNCCA